MRRGLGGAASRRSKAARRQAAPGLIFVGATLASMVCLCCCAHSRPQGCPRRSGCRLSAAAGRTNVHECSPLGGQAIRGRYSRSTFGARRSTQRWLAAPRTRAGQSCERSRRARLAGRLRAGLMLGSRERRRRHRRDPTTKRDRHEVTHRELNGSSMFMSRSMLFVTDAMQPRAANDARGTTSTAQPPLPRCS